MPKRVTSAHGHIYFVQNLQNHYIKIGYSKDVERRYRELEHKVPDSIKLLAKFYCRGPARYERLVHSLFSDLRVKGEWFRPNGRIYDFISYHEESGKRLDHHRVPNHSSFAAVISKAIQERNYALLRSS